MPQNLSALRRSLRSRIAARGGAEAPWRENGLAAARRSLKDRLNSRQKRDRNDAAVPRSRSGHDHDRVSLLQVGQRCGGHASDGLLKIGRSTLPASLTSALPSTWSTTLPRTTFGSLPRCVGRLLPRGPGCGCPVASSARLRVGRSTFEPSRNSLRHGGRQLSELRRIINLDHDRFLGRQVRDVDRTGTGINRTDSARDVAERPGNDLVGSQLGTVGAASAARAKLVSHFDLVQRGRGCIVELYRTRRVAPQHGILGDVHGHALVGAECRGRDRNRSRLPGPSRSPSRRRRVFATPRAHAHAFRPGPPFSWQLRKLPTAIYRLGRLTRERGCDHLVADPAAEVEPRFSGPSRRVQCAANGLRPGRRC